MRNSIKKRWTIVTHLREFIEAYAKRTSARIAGLFVYRLNEALASDDKEVRDVANEWSAFIGGTYADDEVVRASSAVSKTIMMCASVEMVRWLASGSGTCEFCGSLNRKITNIKKYFVNKETGLVVDGKTMEKSGNIGHPPLHGGCNCYIVAE